MIPGGVGWTRWWAEFSSERFDDSFRWGLLHAINESMTRGHGWLGDEHLFAGCIASNRDLERAFRSLTDPVQVIGRAMEWGDPEHGMQEPPLNLDGEVSELWLRLERDHSSGVRKHPVLSLGTQRVLDRAVAIAEGHPVDVRHLFLAVIEGRRSVIPHVLEEMGIPRTRVDAWVRSRAEWGPLIELAREAAATEDDG